MLTRKEGLAKVFRFLFGNSETKTEKKPEIEETTNSNACKRCGAILFPQNHLESDFLDVTVFQCPKCKLIYEKQLSKPDDKLIKEVYIYNQLEGNTVEFNDRLINRKYGNYSLDKLWVIENTICFPMLVQSDFVQGISLIFVPYTIDIMKEAIEGYMITDQETLGYTKLTTRQKISFYANPYLSRLPFPHYKYISIDDEKFNGIEAVSNIRYSLTEVKNDYELRIIHDIPNLCYGIHIYVKFIAPTKKMAHTYSDILYNISFESLIKNNTLTSVGEGYSIINFTISKISGTMSSHIVEDDIRQELVAKIINFFKLVDSA